MKLLLILLLFATGLQAQKSDKVLIADETYFVQQAKAFKIISSNDTVTGRIFKNFQGKFTHYDNRMKEDKRKGTMYWETTYVFPMTEYNNIVKFFNELNASPTAKK